MTQIHKDELKAIVREAVRHTKETGSAARAPDVLRVPASNYVDPDHFKREVDLIFKRIPLMLAPSAELTNPGDFKTMEVVGVPLLLIRGNDRIVRGFLNSCSHRGTNVAVEPTGNAKRFVCPYHGWTYGQDGALVGITLAREFGEIDKSCLGLPQIKVAEHAGLIWGVVTPGSTINIEKFLCGYDRALASFNFESWRIFSKRVIKGPNWKVVYDGYLDYYHLPVLHKATFGADYTNKALYSAWGPHQRIQSPDRDLLPLAAIPENEWSDEALYKCGVWTIFPHVAMAPFNGRAAGVLVSQIFPGAGPGESYTTQYYLVERSLTEKEARETEAHFSFLEYVVTEEDYPVGLRQQHALEAGARKEVLFGRNEGGSQRFHRWLEKIQATADQDLDNLFGSNECDFLRFSSVD
jgi:carnitine monooxygenase subunit